MKQRSFIIFAAALAGALGFAAGKWWPSESALPAGPTAGNRAVSTLPAAVTKADTIKAAPAPREAAVEKFATLSTRAAALTPEQFGQRYAELLSGTDSTDSLLERAAMLAALDPDRAVAAYLAFKKRVGASLQQNTQEIRHLLTVAGERDGAKVIAALRDAAPGFQELSSLVHGWSMKDPAAAVDWYNNLPDGDAQRKTALDGLMWGLSQRDAETTRKVFHSLSPEDQLTSGWSLGRALFTSGGGVELDRLMEGLSPQAAERCLQGACERVFRRAPSETVPWLAAHLGTSETVQRTFLGTFQRWATADRAAAEQWLSTARQSNPHLAGLLNFTSGSIESVSEQAPR